MVDCPYCEQVFDTESAIRKHLHKDHDYESLSRIDRKRVDQYLDENEESAGGDANEDSRKPDDLVAEQRATPDTTTAPATGEMWELEDVQDLSTAAIVDTLADLGIETSEEQFRERATEFTAATALSEQWEAEYDIEADTYDRDFIWMAAEVLWKRWLPDVPNRERIYDFIQAGRDQRDRGNDAEACEQWLTAWEFILAVVPDEITTIDEANRQLPAAVSLDAFVRSLDSDLATLAEDEPAYHERRLEFCQELCAAFPDADDELLLDFRHFVADSLVELDRIAESRTAFEQLIEEYPGDPWAYKKLADSYWRASPDEISDAKLERAADLYEQALAVDGPLEGSTIVRDRLDDIEDRLD